MSEYKQTALIAGRGKEFELLRNQIDFAGAATGEKTGFVGRVHASIGATGKGPVLEDTNTILAL